MDVIKASHDDGGQDVEPNAAMAAPAPMRWIVPGILGEGLTVLAGRAKAGKSLLATDLAVAVAGGGPALRSIACEQGDVFYIDTENGEWRFDARVRALLPGYDEGPLRLEFKRESALQAGLVTALDLWRAESAEPRLVVIDAAQRIGPAGARRWSRGGAREEELCDLQRWAVEHRLAVLVVARTQKDGVDHDGMFGMADATLVLEHKAGGAILRIAGRDAGKQEIMLGFEAGRWSIGGEADEAAREFHRSRIMAVLKSSAWAMRPKHIARELGIPVDLARRTLSRMAQDGQIARWSRGEYLLPAGDHRFGVSTPHHVLPPHLMSKWNQRDSGNP